MTENTTSEPWTKKALAVYEKIPRNRSYALDDVGAQSLAALTAAWHEDYVPRRKQRAKSHCTASK